MEYEVTHPVEAENSELGLSLKALKLQEGFSLKALKNQEFEMPTVCH